jgi:hypothetical protein
MCPEEHYMIDYFYKTEYLHAVKSPHGKILMNLIFRLWYVLFMINVI